MPSRGKRRYGREGRADKYWGSAVRIDVLLERIYVEVHTEYRVKHDPSGDRIHAVALAVFHKRVEEERVRR